MKPPIINIADLDYRPSGHGVPMPGAGEASDRYGARIGAIGSRIGAEKLGYNITAIPPGKAAFPFHAHRVNEEVFLILKGAGEVRIGAENHPVREGDVIACPPGGAETAHQIVNTSTTEELSFFAVSTRLSPDVTEYPQTGRFGVLGVFPSGTDGKSESFRFIGRAGDSLPYWEGE